jgi:ubiquinone/menaquinone biosynthesis C-methylase UbiE
VAKLGLNSNRKNAYINQVVILTGIFNELNNIEQDNGLKEIISTSVFNYLKYLDEYTKIDKNSAFNQFIQDEKGKIEFIDTIEHELFNFKGKNILDVGCGKGGVAIICGEKDANMFALDSDNKEIKIALLRKNKIASNNISFILGSADKLPFPDNFFDLVIATQVLEHVNHLDLVLNEIIRVIKKGGYCCFTCPNPFYPREGHYKVFLIPYLPKNVVILYLRLRGFNPDFFIRSINYPYPSFKKISRYLQLKNMVVEDVTNTVIMKKILDPNKIETKYWKRFFVFIKTLKLSGFFCVIITGLSFFSGFTILAKKELQ